ncbi:molybdate ABC transporter substrate-binding protein [Amaricoccus tamworthensis]|uniref:molybdate ABC transporter substrate-binding protein n=1 Tax=Amaricoccus tamworthensis TaxID=57002 RepID=UPI003C7C61C6
MVRYQVVRLIAAVMLALGPGFGAQARGLVAAASDMQFVMPDLVAAFGATGGGEVEVVFGSSGNLTRQIQQGAPHELFLSADEAYVVRLEEAGLTDGAGVIYAEGRLSLFVPEGSGIGADFAAFEAALAAGGVARFAIANPEHAPYGLRAREALEHRGIWEAVQPVLVLGENVAQAARFAASGNADGGLIAHSLALSPEMSARGESVLVPAEWHSPLLQRMVLMRDAGDEARAFYEWLQSDEAGDILAQAGFSVGAEE